MLDYDPRYLCIEVNLLCRCAEQVIEHQLDSLYVALRTLPLERIQYCFEVPITKARPELLERCFFCCS